MPGVSATACWSALSCCSVSRRALRRVDGEQERAVGARAERLGLLVVRDTLRARLGLVAVVGLADPQLGDREREDQ